MGGEVLNERRQTMHMVRSVFQLRQSKFNVFMHSSHLWPLDWISCSVVGKLWYRIFRWIGWTGILDWLVGRMSYLKILYPFSNDYFVRGRGRTKVVLLWFTILWCGQFSRILSFLQQVHNTLNPEVDHLSINEPSQLTSK